jgi:uncharacterized protein with PIN domain
MVIDPSALAAIVLREPDAETYARAMDEAPRHLLSAVTRVDSLSSSKAARAKKDVSIWSGC